MKNKKLLSSRFHITMPDWLLLEIKKTAEKLGISPSDYIRDTMKADLKKQKTSERSHEPDQKT